MKTVQPDFSKNQRDKHLALSVNWVKILHLSPHPALVAHLENLVKRKIYIHAASAQQEHFKMVKGERTANHAQSIPIPTKKVLILLFFLFVILFQF